ncbi:MAG: hypothetical protein OXH63_18830 [Gemmatimonadetes bacterium]|nr:hypothetical protein [Gemmatimonadota bacterium]
MGADEAGGSGETGVDKRIGTSEIAVGKVGVGTEDGLFEIEVLARPACAQAECAVEMGIC